MRREALWRIYSPQGRDPNIHGDLLGAKPGMGVGAKGTISLVSRELPMRVALLSSVRALSRELRAGVRMWELGPPALGWGGPAAVSSVLASRPSLWRSL